MTFQEALTKAREGGYHHDAFSGIRVLPHSSYARMGRVSRRLAFSCPQYREGVYMAEEPRQEGSLREEV